MLLSAPIHCSAPAQVGTGRDFRFSLRTVFATCTTVAKGDGAHITVTTEPIASPTARFGPVRDGYGVAPPSSRTTIEVQELDLRRWKDEYGHLI